MEQHANIVEPANALMCSNGGSLLFPGAFQPLFFGPLERTAPPGDDCICEDVSRYANIFGGMIIYRTMTNFLSARNSKLLPTRVIPPSTFTDCFSKLNILDFLTPIFSQSNTHT